jgi:hypothetical protein
MWIVCIILVSLLLVTAVLFKHEASRSITVDPNKPFLHDDYDYRKNPTLKHQKVFCENCQFFDGTNVCLAKPMSKVADARVSHCKATSMFVPK